jgi:hypothetical protein
VIFKGVSIRSGKGVSACCLVLMSPSTSKEIEVKEFSSKLLEIELRESPTKPHPVKANPTYLFNFILSITHFPLISRSRNSHLTRWSFSTLRATAAVAAAAEVAVVVAVAVAATDGGMAAAAEVVAEVVTEAAAAAAAPHLRTSWRRCAAE